MYSVYVCEIMSADVCASARVILQDYERPGWCWVAWEGEFDVVENGVEEVTRGRGAGHGWC